MGDSSDGDKPNRQFKNINKDDAQKSILNSNAVLKFIYDVKTEPNNLNTCLETLKKEVNEENFKFKVQIPKNTVVEVDIERSNWLKFLFAYKQSKHVIHLEITENIIEQVVKIMQKRQTKLIPGNGTAKPCDNTNLLTHTQMNTASTSASASGNAQDPHADCISRMNEMMIEVRKSNELLTKALDENKQLRSKISELELIISEKGGKRKAAMQSSSKHKVSKKDGDTNSDENDLAGDGNDEDVEFRSIDLNEHSVPNDKTQTTNQTAHVQNNHSVEPNGLTAHTAKPNKTRNVPPIVVFDDNQKLMSDRLIQRNICKRDEFSFTRINKSKYRIHLSSLTQYDAALAMLNEYEMKFHTYTPSERKPIHVLFKHIPSCYDENEILQFLKTDHGLSPIRITKFNTKFMRDNNIDSSIWHASFEPNTDKKRIFNVKFIGNQYGITVELLKNKSITQCRNCWRFEHTHSNCSYDSRCYQCLDIHNEGECRRDSNEALLPACVNCKKENHTAVDKKCPVFLRTLERKSNTGNKKTNASLPKQNTRAESNAKQHTNFADTLRPAKASTQTVSSDLNSIMHQIANQQVQINEFLLKIAPQLLNNQSNV